MQTTFYHTFEIFLKHWNMKKNLNPEKAFDVWTADWTSGNCEFHKLRWKRGKRRLVIGMDLLRDTYDEISFLVGRVPTKSTKKTKQVIAIQLLETLWYWFQYDRFALWLLPTPVQISDPLEFFSYSWLFSFVPQIIKAFKRQKFIWSKCRNG